MAAKKFLRLVNGIFTEIVATVTSAGAGNAGDIVALDDSGKLDATVMPAGIGADTTVLPAVEALTAGDFVNIFNDSGTIKCRKAVANAAGKEAHGFVLSSVSEAANATIYRAGTNSAVTGLTAGVIQYLSASSAGAATATPPSTSGYIVQKLGVTSSATSINFQPSDFIVLA